MIYKFDDKRQAHIQQVGGKGKALIETSQAGFPVPPGFVLSVDFFQSWTDQVKATSLWQYLLEEASEETCQKLQDFISSLDLNEDQDQAFESALSHLDGQSFAVRSSSPEEDLEESSFAGMYETKLGITRSNLNEAVKEIYKSCYDFRVISYKLNNKLSLESTAIAIVVQEQVQSDISGVGFSINPINNAYDEVFINASYGLGEMIVSGLVTPDTYVYDKVKKSIIEKKLGDKSTKMVVSATGGVAEEDVNSKGFALTDQEVTDISDLIDKCERYYDKPIDIEWAIKDNNLFLLQARPITTYFPVFEELMTQPGEDKRLYIDILNITQGFSDSLSVLGGDIWSNIVVQSGGRVLTCGPNGTAPVHNGRQYFNIFYLYKALGEKLGNGYMFGHDATAQKMMQSIDLDQYRLNDFPDTVKGAKFNMLKMGLHFARPTLSALFLRPDKQIEKYLDTFKKTYQHASFYNSKTPFRDTVQAAVDDIYKIISSSGLLMAGLLASNNLKKMFKDTGLELELAALSMDLDGNPTSEMGHLQFKLASYDEFINTSSALDFVNQISSNTYSEAFMADYKTYIDKHGARTFKEIDIASPRASDNLKDLFFRLKEINLEDSQISKVKEKKTKAYKKLLTIAKQGGFEKKFIKQAKIFQSTFGYREYMKYSTVSFIGKLRQVAFEIADSFMDQGRLAYRDQIFDLTIEDISLGQANPDFDLLSRVKKNLIPYEKTKHVKDWPIMFDSRGKIYRPKLEVKDGDLIGMAISPGKYVGKAKVLQSPYEKQLEPGEILVTRSTEPSWTPIFINASAVLMEVGGPLQHGGIIAREYGIPCVSGLIGITKMVKDGDLIEVDGTSGIVRIL